MMGFPYETYQVRQRYDRVGSSEVHLRNYLSIETLSRDGRQLVSIARRSPMARLPLENHNVHKSRSMHTLDSRHFNICGGRRSAEKSRWKMMCGLQKPHSLNYSLDNILLPHHAKVIIRNQGNSPAPFLACTLQNNRASFSDCQRC